MKRRKLPKHGTQPLQQASAIVEGYVSLYRAVDVAELKSILDHKKFLPSPSGTERKGFFFARADAERFRIQQLAVGGSDTTVVSASAPAELVDSSFPHPVMTEGAGVNILTRDLKQVSVDV